jgi:predicted ribosome quality control (RQC) complex YloA/Tae2 family protein
VHNNYFYLRKLAEALKKKLTGWKIGTCFSQEKNTLVIGIFSGSEEFFIKADQNFSFSCLSFPESFPRAKKNSIDLFPQLINREILDVFPYRYERAFSFKMDQDLVLLFKLFGNFSNILLFEKENCIDVFKHNLKDVEKIRLPNLDRDIVINEASFYDSGCSPKRLIPPVNNVILEYMEGKGFNGLDKYGKWRLLSKTLEELKNPQYYIVSINQDIKFRLFPTGKIIKKSIDPLSILSEFYLMHQKQFWFHHEKSRLIKKLSIRLKKIRQYIDKLRKLQKERKAGLNYRQMADIIMANLHNLKLGYDDAELFDFYNNKTVRIKLNPKLSPQKNAENYYRKSKNQQKEFETIRNNINEKMRTASQLDNYIKQIEGFQNLKSLRIFSKKYQLESGSGRHEDAPRFKYYEYLGFIILVGKNAKNNEELTFEYGYKEDLWLHAKDVSGSHVLIKYQAGKPFPKPVIERAGQLAAYYSKNRNMQVCTVIYTEKKFVRKFKGAAPGIVRVDRENILFVNPSNHS